jgi:teichuronic acid biosynthesis glycosyltransferase TuaC
MLRVLTLSTLFPDASRPTFAPFVERQTLGLAALPDVEVTVVAPIGLPPFARHFARYRGLAALPLRETWKGLDVHRPRFTHIPGLPQRDARALAKALRPLLDTLAFDVIDVQFFWPDGPAAVALGRHYGVPVSIKARGADIHYWGHRAHTGHRVVAAGKGADGMLAVSAALKADMAALGMAGERIAVHYTGIDREVFQVRDRAAAKAALGIQGPLVVSVGALIPRKGQGFVIDALPALPDVTLAMIGKGEDESMLRTKAAALGVGDRVVFLGTLPATGIVDWLAAADVMALPSLSEGLANAWVEALACGTPVVTCDIGGARELIDRPEAGRLVERTPDAIASAVRDILVASPSRQAVAASVGKFSWQTNAEQLRAHLARLVG